MGDHVVWLRFRDGTSGEVDLLAELYGTVFEPLREVLASIVVIATKQ